MEEEKKKNILEHLSVETGIIVLIAIIIIGILFYLGVISFNPSAKKTQLNATTANLLVVGCPVSDALCQSSQTVKVPTAKYSMLVWNIPKNSDILAVFDGTLKQEIQPISSSSAIYITTITSSNGKYSAHYIFASSKLDKAVKAATLPDKKVKSKELISPANENGSLFKDNYINFTFYVSTGNIPMDINPKEFGKITLP